MLDGSRAEKKLGGRAKLKSEEGVEEFWLGMPGWEDECRIHFISRELTIYNY